MKKKIKILVGLCSAHGYENRRQMQRKTMLKFPRNSVECVFFLGNKPPEKTTDKDLNEPDIVILDANDDYGHLPIKVKSFFDYALAHYDFDWLFKCDDDTYIALDRLEELINDEFDLIGDVSLAERGAPSGGAGYFLSKSLVEKMILHPRIPEVGYEDIVYGKLAAKLHARAHSTERLCMYNSHYPRKDNELVTSHWLSTNHMRAIHLIYHTEDILTLSAEHKHWGIDNLNFCKEGVFYRGKSDCYGYWSYDENKLQLILEWCSWDSELLIKSNDVYSSALLTLQVSPAEESLLRTWQSYLDQELRVENELTLVHIGCGSNLLKGWNNVDLPNIDITKPLPYESESVDAFFLEHVIEHVTPAEAYHFFMEAWRTLKPGGVLRLAFPDLLRIVQYATPRYRDFIQLNGWGNGHIGSEVRSIIVNHGHKAIWTLETMKVTLESIGFSTYPCDIGLSWHSHLNNLEHHGDQITQDINRIETSCIEAIKPYKSHS